MIIGKSPEEGGPAPVIIEILCKNQSGKYEKIEVQQIRGICMLGQMGI